MVSVPSRVRLCSTMASIAAAESSGGFALEARNTLVPLVGEEAAEQRLRAAVPIAGGRVEVAQATIVGGRHGAGEGGIVDRRGVPRAAERHGKQRHRAGAERHAPDGGIDGGRRIRRHGGSGALPDDQFGIDLGDARLGQRGRWCRSAASADRPPCGKPIRRRSSPSKAAARRTPRWRCCRSP